jgi:hypothetical protein
VSVKRSAGGLRRLVSDLFSMARAEKKWWLLPMVLLLLVITLLMVGAALTGPLAPFLYPLL